MITFNFARIVKNKKGSALLMSLMVVGTLVTLSAAFTISTVNEMNNSRRYQSSAKSFWIAEAGVNEFMADPSMLDAGDVTRIFGTYSVDLSKDDTDPNERILTAIATANGVSRTLEVKFPANPAILYDNTMSSGGDLNLFGLLAKLDIYDKTRLSGEFNKSGFLSIADLEDLQENVPSDQTTFTYPDADENGTPDEFSDFVQFNRDLIATYDPSEVLYISGDSTQLIYPNGALAGKKIIYVEGGSPGTGDVNVLFDTTWQTGENMTIISTGDVFYVQPLQIFRDSQLNVVSWNDYNEASILLSSHDGVTYAHDNANFLSVLSYSETRGNVISNGDIDCFEALTWKRFIYDDAISEGSVPPGFEGLLAASGGGYSSTPSSWKEI